MKMKAFIVVSLVCYLGAASAGITSPAVPLGKTAEECRHQAYLEALNCTRFGFNNGTAELTCVSVTVLDYMNCMEETEPKPEVKLRSLGASLPGVEPLKINKLKCILKNLLETLKCIVDGDFVAGIQTVNWPAIIKCLVTNLPALLVCFPQNP